MFKLTFPRRAGLALAAGLLVSFAADAQPARPDLAARLQRATSGLDLSAEQQEALQALASRYADADPADLWQAAAEVNDVLTDAQVAQLREAQEARRGERREGRDERTRQPRRAQTHRALRDGRGQRLRGERPRLTDEQRQSLRDARNAQREQMQALVQQLRDGEISDDAFVARSEALREQAAEELRSVLPAEQRERLAEAEARREAAEAAREAALDLTDAQKEAFQALALDRIRSAPERPDLRPYLDDEGRLDREALRADQRDRREAQRERREAARDEAADILTDEQEAIVALHRAIAGARFDGRADRPGRGRRGAGFGR